MKLEIVRQKRSKGRSGRPRICVLAIRDEHIVDYLQKCDLTLEDIVEFANQQQQYFAKPNVATVENYLL